MRAKLIVEGKEFDIEIQDPELQKLVAHKKTGYERVDINNPYYVDHHGNVICCDERADIICEHAYYGAHYYSDRTVAENNARADKLMRQLRRFAVEHRENGLDWQDDSTDKYFIFYNHSLENLSVHASIRNQTYCVIYFDSLDAANLAIDTFRDELIWYFTEYKDSL